MTKTLIAIGTVALFAIIGLTFLLTGVGMYNSAKRLKVQYEAKVTANHAELDNLKKKISQSAEVTDEQMKALERLFVGYADARTKGGEHSLANWIKEAVPNVDTSTFKNLQNIVVGSRDSWTMRQTELVDISREYNQMLEVFPSNLILGALGFQKINPVVVTSASTKKAFSTGRDEETGVFKK